jgi:hypothetical protein
VYRPKLVLACVLVAPAFLAGCGDDASDTSTTTEAAAAADPTRYCELTEELDAAGEEIFAPLEQDQNATREDFEQAEAQLVEENQGQLEQIQQVAPPEIRPDVETIVSALYVRAGLEEAGPSNSEVGAAEKRLDAFEKENCA